MWLDYEVEITAPPLLTNLAEDAIDELKEREPPE
jgi:hypothetical protein